MAEDAQSYGGDSPFPVVYGTEGSVHQIFLFWEISSAAQFIPAIQLLLSCSEGETVVIHLSCPGGDVDATDSFVQAMNECAGTVVVKASGGCHSCASIILLNADEVMLSQWFSCLVHCGSVTTGGTFNEHRVASSFVLQHTERMFRETYKGFLSETEIVQLLEGKDFWFDAEQFVLRMEARNRVLGITH